MTPLLVLKDASREPVFWVLFATFFVCGASTNGLIQTHFVALCGDFGLVPVGAASVLALMGAFDLVGTIGSGWLSDRYDNRWLLFWYYGLRGLSLLYLPFTDFSFYGLSLFAMFYGLDWLATVPPTVKLTVQRFGPGTANIVFGWIFAGHQLGAASAAFGAGLSRTVLSSYLPAFFVSGVLCIVAALLVIAIAKPNRTTQGPRGLPSPARRNHQPSIRLACFNQVTACGAITAEPARDRPAAATAARSVSVWNRRLAGRAARGALRRIVRRHLALLLHVAAVVEVAARDRLANPANLLRQAQRLSGVLYRAHRGNDGSLACRGHSADCEDRHGGDEKSRAHGFAPIANAPTSDAWSVGIVCASIGR